MADETKRFAEVILPLPIDKSFQYRVGDEFLHLIKEGERVVVPFGARQMTGYVTKLSSESAVPNLKNISSLVDAEPLIYEELVSLARWIAENYVCSFGEALSAVLPPNLRPPRRAVIQHKTENKRHITESFADKHKLTDAQKETLIPIYEKIDSNSFGAFLLHGVTSSGKTEVYLSAADKVIKAGKSVIFLLPEISLTPQFISIIAKRFPNLVGVWHSHISDGEKYRTRELARHGNIKIMLGARSAVFAPFGNLGLIIVDEEHEPSYKQDQKPNYQTREVALERARLNNACVILGSATPLVETYFRAKSGEIQLLELPERIDSISLPPVRIVDLNRAARKHKIISEPMVSSINRVLARREQAIIFLNRRGFATGLMCRNCARVWRCPHCSISLVYHKDKEALICHYCSHKESLPAACPDCGAKNISIFGVGTQKVEAELKNLFPQARVFRLDRDSASKRGVYQRVYEDFKKEDFDILLGTQLVVKGFDFPRVTLTGVVDADTALNLPDFHSAERTFQLITQAAGRSGRSRLGGEVIMQTYHPNHYALTAAQKHDYKSFYDTEIGFRKQLCYPPFCALVNIMVRGRSEEKAVNSINEIFERLTEIKNKTGAGIEILGPTPAARPKLHSLFRWQLLLKGNHNELLSAARSAGEYKPPRGILVSIDVDPQSIL